MLRSVTPGKGPSRCSLRRLAPDPGSRAGHRPHGSLDSCRDALSWMARASLTSLWCQAGSLLFRGWGFEWFVPPGAPRTPLAQLQQVLCAAKSLGWTLHPAQAPQAGPAHVVLLPS